LQIWHHTLRPFLDFGVAVRWHGRLSGRIWLASLLHCSLSSWPDQLHAHACTNEGVARGAFVALAARSTAMADPIDPADGWLGSEGSAA
jgi:hypothetical protein